MNPSTRVTIEWYTRYIQRNSITAILEQLIQLNKT